MRFLIFMLLAMLLAGCASQPNLMPIQTPNVVLTPTERMTQQEPFQQIMPMPHFIYWAGVETNYSQIQSSTNLINWTTIPVLFYGPPDSNTVVTVKADQPCGFFRMIMLTNNVMLTP